MMEKNLLPWTEKYRPKSLDEVVGQKEILESLKSFVKHKNMPNLLFAGPPGVGKTTSALALAKEIFGESFSSNFSELNASDERGIDVVRGRIKDFAKSVALGAVPFKLIFLDEADALTTDAQQALRRTMESSASATRFIISANYSSRIIDPIQSRCAVYRFMPLTETEVKKALVHIAKSENIKVDDEAYAAIFYVSEGDMRKAVNILQTVAMQSNHVTEESIHKAASKATPKEIEMMLKLAVSGNFVKAREQLDTLLVTYGLSGEDILLQTYRSIPKLDISDKEKIQLVALVGEYNFRLVQGANERIQIEAFLAQVGLTKQS